MQFDEALRLLAAFERHDVAYVLVGSMAMAAQGVVRATRRTRRSALRSIPTTCALRSASPPRPCAWLRDDSRRVCTSTGR
jgi:hypothetical protein